jgi:hypothetical protein
VISGKSVLLCDGDQLVDVVQRGQGVLNLLSLAGVKQELDRDIVPLHEENGAKDTVAAAR